MHLFLLNASVFPGQILGYGVRIVSYFCTNQIAPYAVQSSLIVLAPAFYAVSIYMVLGRLIRSVHGERFSIVHPSRMTKLFVLCDLLTLNVQANGAGLTANKKLQKVGEYIVVAGLFLQLAVFGFFVAAAVIFHVRMGRYVVKESALRPDVPWRQGLKMLYACSMLIIVRSIFRVIEYLMGVDAYLLAHEWPMYVFDAVPMWAVQVIFLVWFPDKFQPRQGNVGEDGHVLVGNESPMR